MSNLDQQKQESTVSETAIVYTPGTVPCEGQEYRDEGIIPASGCTVFEANVGAQYGNDNTRFRYHYITLVVHYHIAYHHDTKTFDIIHCRCGIIENDGYVEYLNS